MNVSTVGFLTGISSSKISLPWRGIFLKRIVLASGFSNQRPPLRMEALMSNDRLRFNVSQWLETLQGFQEPRTEGQDEDDLYLIKQYARLRLSSMKQVRHDYKMEFGEDCSINFTFDQIVMKIMEKYHAESKKPVNPDMHLPRHIHPIDFNSDALKNSSRGAITKLIPGTVLEREYHGEVYVVYCRQGYYEYSRRKYRTLTTIAREISGTYCSGPNFFIVLEDMFVEIVKEDIEERIQMEGREKEEE